MADDPDGGDRDGEDERADGSDESGDPFESLHDVDEARRDRPDDGPGSGTEGPGPGEEETESDSGVAGDRRRPDDRQTGPAEGSPDRDRPRGQPTERARDQPVGREGGQGSPGGPGSAQRQGQSEPPATGRGQPGAAHPERPERTDEEPPGERATEARGERILAHFLDFTLLTIAAFVTWFVVLILAAIVLAATMEPTSPAEPTGSPGGDGAFILVALVTWLVVGVELLGYYGLLDATGGTIGKRVAGLSVVTEDGESASMKHTAVRTLVLLAPLPVMAAFGSLIPGLGFFIAVGIMIVWLGVEAAVLILSSSAQRLGDKLANTYVVERD